MLAYSVTNKLPLMDMLSADDIRLIYT